MTRHKLPATVIATALGAGPVMLSAQESRDAKNRFVGYGNAVAAKR
jgi:hypothetical protein